MFQPVDQAEGAVLVFGERGAAFDPVAGIAVEQVVDGLEVGAVDVAADDAVDLLPADFRHQGLFEIAHVVDGFLAFVLEPGRDREIAAAGQPPQPVVPAVEDEQGVVENAADVGQPLAVLNHAVEPVAMQDQEATAVGGGVDGFVADPDAVEFAAALVAQHGVVVARQVEDPGPLFRLAQDQVDDGRVGCRPVPVALDFPEIEDVADQVEVFRFGGGEEMVEYVLLMASCSICTSFTSKGFCSSSVRG